MSVRNKRHQREFYALIEPICGSVICSVTVRFRVSVYVRVRAMVRVRVADCCMQTAGQSDKMRISHVIKTDQWRSDPRIRSAPHFVVFPSLIALCHVASHPSTPPSHRLLNAREHGE